MTGAALHTEPAVASPPRWSPEKSAQLAEMWASGRTGAEIAVAMGTTRSAVLGRLMRLGLCGTPRLSRPPRPARPHCRLAPIASAPKDGSLIVAFSWWKGEWRDIGPARFTSDPRVIAEPAWVHDEHGEVLEPTHWLPWPNPPSEATVTAIGDAA